VWEGESLEIVPPAPALEGLLRANQCTLRQFRLILEVIDSKRDVVIIDMGGIPSSVARKLYDMADDIIYLLSLDPSTVHASLMRLKSLTNVTPGEQSVQLVPVSAGKDGISSKSLIKEFERCLKIRGAAWADQVIPYVSAVRQWPGSGSSPLELGDNSYRNAFLSLGAAMNFHTKVPGQEIGPFSRVISFVSLIGRRMKPVGKNSTHPSLPEKPEVPLLEPPKDDRKSPHTLITRPTIVVAS
jgi:hypothetical protein